MNPEDTITIAPSVILTTAVKVTQDVDGVARMGTVPDVVNRLFRGHPISNGVVVEFKDAEVVKLDLYIITKGNANLLDVSKEVQEAVTRTIQELAGMTVTAVNVHVEDVEYTDAS